MGSYQFSLNSMYIGEYIPPRTFTISRTETSDPASFNPVYSDDAAGLTAGSTAFDEFFGYYGCRLSNAGIETARVSQSSPGTLDITQLGTLTSGDNVMIAFPRRGIKMSKSGTTVTLSITEEPNKNGYQYYAFNRDGSKQDKFYLGAYEGTGSYSKIVSLSGASPITSQTISGARNACAANGTNYQQITCWARWYVSALYMMKYGNPNSQSLVGMGYVGGSSKVNTGGTDSQTSATYGTQNDTDQIKLFGLEDWWGNVTEWCDGIRGGYVNTTNNINKMSGNEGWVDTGVAVGNSGYITSIASTNIGMFMPSAYGGSVSTYYCDYGYVLSGYYALAGSNAASLSGIFNLTVNYSSSDTKNTLGTRLMYL